MPIEIERKFLIRLPDFAVLSAMEGYRVRRITQTYLRPIKGSDTERRVRKIEEDGHVIYVFTKKEKITKMTRREDEREIDAAEYLDALREAYSSLTKTRFSFPYEKHVIEIDVYPSEIGGPELEGYAVLEVELASEGEDFSLPPFIEVVEELTGTRKFSNKALAKRVEKA